MIYKCDLHSNQLPYFQSCICAVNNLSKRDGSPSEILFNIFHDVTGFARQMPTTFKENTVGIVAWCWEE